MIKPETQIKIDDVLVQPESTIRVLDEVMNARDALFEAKLSDGFTAHKKLMDSLPK